MEHTKAYEMAIKYYPRLWDKEALIRLVEAGKLREDEYQQIVGEPYPA